MKCPKCGQEMYSMGNGGFDTERGNYVETKYVCPKCHYEVSENWNDLVYRTPLFQPTYTVTNYGWICPKCGAVLSPSTKECPYCTPHNKSTCRTIGEPPIKTVPLGNNIISQAQVYNPPQNLMDNITVTGNGDLTLKPQAETMVSK